MTPTQAMCEAIGIDLEAFIRESMEQGKTQEWMAHQLGIEIKAIKRHAVIYGIEWPKAHEVMARRNGVVIDGVLMTRTGHCKRLGISDRRAFELVQKGYRFEDAVAHLLSKKGSRNRDYSRSAARIAA